MSTYFFKTNINSQGSVTQIKPQLDKMESDKTIDRWHVDFNHPEHILEIETQQLSPEEVKHAIRAAGFDADFTKAPQER